MNSLKERIKLEGKHLGDGILKVDAFMNHQIDPVLMRSIGEEFARYFRESGATRILTAESSGIAPALATAMVMNIPLVYARKHRPLTMGGAALKASAPSPTHGGTAELIVSSEYLTPDDSVLILDDFLSSARTIRALVDLVKGRGARLVGVGAVIEKSFQGGRAVLADIGVPIVSLAVIQRLDGDNIVLA